MNQQPNLPMMGKIAILVTAANLLAALAAPAAGRTDVIVVSGDAAPDGNGIFQGLFLSGFNNRGELAFRATLSGTQGATSDNSGVFVGSKGMLTQLAREGQLAPDGNGAFDTFFSSSLNNAGDVAYWARLRGTSGGTTDDHAILRASGYVTNQIVRKGSTAPDGNGFVSGFLPPTINDAGQVAFEAFFSGTSGGSNDDRGILLGSGGPLTQLERDGQPSPHAGSNLNLADSYSGPRHVNNLGQVAFEGALTNSPNGSSDDTGLYRSDGATPVEIVRENQIAPDGFHRFQFFNAAGPPAINDQGEVAFYSQLTNQTPGIFRGSGGAVTQIALRGQLAPDGNGQFDSFNGPHINNRDDVAFVASITGAASGPPTRTSIFMDSAGALREIVRPGQLAPDGNGNFTDFSFSVPQLNNAGEILFGGTLSGTAGGGLDDAGVFLYSSGPDLIQVARKGDPFLGSTITQLSGLLNDLGQVALTFELADGRSGLAIWSVPEAASGLLFAVGVIAVMAAYRRRH